MSSKSTALRQLLNDNGIIVAPGAYDCISAKIVEQLGFSAIYLTGAGMASSRLGVPDIGLMTMTEVVETAKNIVQATNIPIICDADTGYGNAINLIRTTREFEQTGVAAIQIEDQITPKRCGHTEGKQIIPKEEMVKKIEAFHYAKTTDLVLIARTDAIAVTGFEDAIDRARSYAQAGADILFVEAPHTVDEVRRISDELSGTHLLVNIVEKGGKTPSFSTQELERMGFKIAIYPTAAWTAAIKAMRDVLRQLKAKGMLVDVESDLVSFQEMFELVDSPGYKALEKRFLDF
jgi:carboxyvinyl-carboxyphosphonate phosphorylmutase